MTWNLFCHGKVSPDTYPSQPDEKSTLTPDFAVMVGRCDGIAALNPSYVLIRCLDKDDAASIDFYLGRVHDIACGDWKYSPLLTTSLSNEINPMLFADS